MKFLAILLIILAAAKHSYAQDTTGGTRPTIVIPLHKTAEKKAVGSTINTETTPPVKGSPSLNATDSKLRAAAASKKYKRKMKNRRA